MNLDKFVTKLTKDEGLERNLAIEMYDYLQKIDLENARPDLFKFYEKNPQQYDLMIQCKEYNIRAEHRLTKQDFMCLVDKTVDYYMN